MSNRLFARGIITGVSILVAVSLGCDKSPSSPTLPAVSPVTVPAAVTVTAVSPTRGPTNFASEIRVVGTGFLTGATLTLDGVAATVTSVTSTTIIAMTPVHAAGTVDVVVTNPGGVRGALTGGYTFEIVSISLTASPNLVASGGQLTVSWVASSGQSRSDWVGFFKVGYPSTTYQSGWWQYTDGAASGTLTLSAPTQPGEYEFRYLLDDGFIDVARSSPVTVSASAPPLISAARARER